MANSYKSKKIKLWGSKSLYQTVVQDYRLAKEGFWYKSNCFPGSSMAHVNLFSVMSCMWCFWVRQVATHWLKGFAAWGFCESEDRPGKARANVYSCVQPTVEIRTAKAPPPKTPKKLRRKIWEERLQRTKIFKSPLWHNLHWTLYLSFGRVTRKLNSKAANDWHLGQSIYLQCLQSLLLWGYWRDTGVSQPHAAASLKGRRNCTAASIGEQTPQVQVSSDTACTKENFSNTIWTL